MTPRTPTLPAVLFDMDGTLVDSIELIAASADHAFGSRDGPRPTRAEWQSLIGTPLDAMIDRWARDAADAEFVRTRYRAFQVKHHDEYMRLYDDVEETVRVLHEHGHPLAIVSSRVEGGIHRALDHFRLTGYFDTIVGLESTTEHKPHPAPVHLALEQLHVTAREAVFVGDSPHDVAAAKAAHVRVLAATWGAFTREQIAPTAPDGWIERMADLPRQIAQVL